MIKKKALSKSSPAIGIGCIAGAIVIALSLFSFVDGDASHNWLGLFGHALSWGLHYILGLSSFFIPGFLACIGFASLFRRPFEHPILKTIYFFLFLISLSTLLAVIAENSPLIASYFKRWTYSDYYPRGALSKASLRTYLGGVPLHHLYTDFPFFNFRNLFGTLGTLLIFSSLFLISGFFLIPFSYDLFLSAGQKLLTRVRTPPKSRPDLSSLPFSNLEIEEQESDSEELSLERPHPLKTTSEQMVKKETVVAPKPQPKIFSDYTLPPPSLLTQVKKLDQTSLKNDLRRQAERLEETLLSFGIEAKVGDIHCGPTITLFELHPAIGVKVQKIKALENDIAMNLQAKSIRIIAPIPGKAAVGVEVPNPRPQEVSFREMIENYQTSGKNFSIPLLLGKMVNGEDVWSDLTKMPHCIIAGATGSGKSVCINSIVMSIVMNARPDEIKLLMIDPKKVELTSYSPLPHMLAPVITEPHGACSALKWLVKEMERRYEFFRVLAIRNIHGFNTRKIDKEFETSLEMDIPEKLPFIILIIDELADLMMVSSSDIETPCARIAQMARAVGIHLIVATQRPSREVITGLIKANFPSRIAFKVASRVNSQIIIDEIGAESLLGNGDMLFMPPGTSHLVRAQGAFIRDDDINQVIGFICKQAPTNYLIPSFDDYREGKESHDEDEEETPSDALYDQAKTLVLTTGNASTTYLQRKLKIGYARAASLMDLLENKGIIGPQEGAKPRKIYYPNQKQDDNISPFSDDDVV